jgi:hypothetical protein
MVKAYEPVHEVPWSRAQEKTRVQHTMANMPCFYKKGKKMKEL